MAMPVVMGPGSLANNACAFILVLSLVHQFMLISILSDSQSIYRFLDPPSTGKFIKISFINKGGSQ